MKLVRYGQAGQEKPAILDDEGQLRDLSAIVPDINGETLYQNLDKIREADISASLILSKF